METDLTDLVDFPRETLEVEVKGWMDLGDKAARTNIARHIAALANHGGGISSSAHDRPVSPPQDRPQRL